MDILSQQLCIVTTNSRTVKIILCCNILGRFFEPAYELVEFRKVLRVLALYTVDIGFD
jgi:hypothetical protein